MARLSLTLFYVSIILALAASSNANSHRRDHADLGRLMRKRAPPGIFGGGTQSGQTVSTSVQAAQPSQPSSAVVQSTPPSTAQSPSSTNEASSSASNANGPSSTGPSITSSTPSSTLSLASSQPSNTPQTADQVSQAPIASPSNSILYLTTGPSSAPTPTPSGSPPTSSGMSHTAMTVLIVIAACVGASVIVWTIIRKWKFRPSSDFEGRMQPIDWQPGAGGDDGLSGHRSQLSRSSSFHSGSGNANDQLRGPAGYGTTPLNPIPDHDFTAGPAHPAPVGGYADLARGATPQPMMQEPLGMAPSVNRPVQYDQYGVPLHHGYNGY